jgi:alkanesulfonate monooxygenase SsuD/methylene tetrahydromethanopterin reductase-like flavin-dependent oxidoreductase (luciferase family)
VTVAVHLRVPHRLAAGPADELATFVELVEGSDLDGLTVGDHVSFRDGSGYDGLIQAAALATMSTRLEIWTAVYLLALRHPVTVARQVSSLAALAPGRFAFGVGLGGDDRHELEVCGIDPRRRGRRFDTCLDIVRPLLDGATVSSDDPELPIPAARVLPAPEPRVPIVVGGRSDAALRRAGRVGDGWIALWHSPERVALGIEQVESAAHDHGRGDAPRRYAYTVWCGFDEHPERARDLLAGQMESLYHRPFSSFERYSPFGSPDHVATTLEPYVEAGIGDLVVIGVAADDRDLVECVQHVASRLGG